ncbi:helix-turn-helix domain-containing protein [Nocardia brasiliensis]|uniref:helix-turn-helix domain-containing protein n=1 Tax=Nocardia brasiliensis TaxID=37326 RepID=UPI00245700F9|nr:helix-turn-helix domain-containing protein [Nocardia brasiliensis]
MDTSKETWLSTEEVAQRLKVPIKTLAVWASGCRGPRFARIGRFRRYRLNDLVAWEAEQLRNGGGSDITSHDD